MAVRRLGAIMLALALASPAIAQQCDFMAATGDAQYTATNIRAAPSSTATIVMTLEATAPVEVHVTRRQGNWYRIDRIINAEEDKQIFRGTAWIHRSQLVLSVAGGDHRLYRAPDRTSAAVMRLTPDGNLLDIVDCRGRWIKAIVDRKTMGWMAPDAQCSNPMTTCS
jgi:hypothetical protein